MRWIADASRRDRAAARRHDLFLNPPIARTSDIGRVTSAAFSPSRQSRASGLATCIAISPPPGTEVTVVWNGCARQGERVRVTPIVVVAAVIERERIVPADAAPRRHAPRRPLGVSRRQGPRQRDARRSAAPRNLRGARCGGARRRARPHRHARLSREDRRAVLLPLRPGRRGEADDRAGDALGGEATS